MDLQLLYAFPRVPEHIRSRHLMSDATYSTPRRTSGEGNGKKAFKHTASGLGVIYLGSSEMLQQWFRYLLMLAAI